MIDNRRDTLWALARFVRLGFSVEAGLRGSYEVLHYALRVDAVFRLVDTEQTNVRTANKTHTCQCARVCRC